MFKFLRRKEPVVEVTSSVEWVKRDESVYEVTVHGRISESQFRDLQAQGAAEIEAVGAISVLMDLRDMQGWAKEPVGDNLDFLLAYDKQIKKIAIVGDAQKDAHYLAFFGDGYRHAEVKFFPPESLNAAREWVVE